MGSLCVEPEPGLYIYAKCRKLLAIHFIAYFVELEHFIQNSVSIKSQIVKISTINF